MLHILFISYDGMTDPLGQSQVIPYLSGLTRYGYRFTILSCEKPDRYKRHKEEIETLLAPLSIQWVPLVYHRNPPVISAMSDLWNIKRTAARLHAREPFDMVHTRSGTPALAGLWMKKKLGIKFLNDIRDFYADSRVDSGQWNQNNLIYRLVYRYFRKKEQQELSNSDGIVCLTHKAEKIIRSRSEYPAGAPLAVIPCSVDIDLFNPENVSTIRKEELMKKFNFHDGDIVFSYLGSFGTWYLENEMLTLFRVIQEKISHARFLIISPDDAKLINKLVKESGIESGKVVIISATRKEVPALLSLSTYSVFFIKSCFSKQASSPTKLGEIMAMGIPVITNSGVGDVTEIVHKYQSGIIVDPLTKEHFEKLVQELLQVPEFDKNAIRMGAKDYFALENAVTKYRKIYEAVLSS